MYTALIMSFEEVERFLHLAAVEIYCQGDPDVAYDIEHFPKMDLTHYAGKVLTKSLDPDEINLDDVEDPEGLNLGDDESLYSEAFYQSLSTLINQMITWVETTEFKLTSLEYVFPLSIGTNSLLLLFKTKEPKNANL